MLEKNKLIIHCRRGLGRGYLAHLWPLLLIAGLPCLAPTRHASGEPGPLLTTRARSTTARVKLGMYTLPVPAGARLVERGDSLVKFDGVKLPGARTGRLTAQSGIYDGPDIVPGSGAKIRYLFRGALPGGLHLSCLAYTWPHDWAFQGLVRSPGSKDSMMVTFSGRAETADSFVTLMREVRAARG